MTTEQIALSVDELAQIIRTVDGSNSLGAGALAEAILASLPPARVEEGPAWQPIETAPKDGTTILMGKWHDGWYWIASGSITGDVPVDTVNFWCDFTDDDFEPFSHQNPTHWQPLPAPPAIRSEK